MSTSPTAHDSGTSPESASKPKPRSLGQVLFSIGLAAMGVAVMVDVLGWNGRFSLNDPRWDETPTPLVMKGGNPYIRALMRTISAAESNDPQPYSLLYGGDRIADLSQHPDQCVPIVTGPNVGDCTTAAGRYQFITTTWMEQSHKYHPHPSGFWLWQSYSFTPEAQDEVVYGWLNDPQAWGVDLAQLLQEGRLTEVLQILSPTWTSLGYGIEPNSMTDYLPEIYQQVLQEELQQAH